MKAVLQYRATPGFRAAISALESDWLRIAVVDETDKETFAREMQDADVLLHVLERVTGPVIEQAPRLKLIQKLGVGVDTIDLEAARARGIAVCNMPGANTRAVAELTLLLMLATLRRVAELDRQTRAGKGWALDSELLDNLGELGGRTVGLVGFGAVGQVPGADAARHRRERHLYIARPKPRHRAATFVSFADLLSSADVVSLHVPLTAQTAAMIDARAIDKMKRGAVLVNTARGGLVDYGALEHALASGHLRGAGLDVFDAEPANAAHPLFRLPNVVVTPHVAWFTAETLEQKSWHVRGELPAAARREPLLNRVV